MSNHYSPFPQTNHVTEPTKAGAVPCTRCGGTGIYHTYGVCFRCGGNGIDPTEREWLLPKSWTVEQCIEWNEKRLARNTRATETRKARKAERLEAKLNSFLNELDDEIRTELQRIRDLPFEEKHYIADDILFKLGAYGSISQAQLDLVFKVQREFEEEQLEAERKAEEDAKRPVLEEGRYTIVGSIVGTKVTTNRYDPYGGGILKMIVELEDGNKVYGTVPSSLDFEHGDRVQFDAAVERARDDEHFGFFKRPTKSQNLSQAEEAE